VTAAVITVAHGRHDHLRRQEQSLSRLDPAAEHRVVVALDDPAISTLTAPGSQVINRPSRPDAYGLALAAGRNLGATAAREKGADLLVFLDVDCLADPGLVGWYQGAADRLADHPTLLAGPVSYLPPPPVGGYRLDALGDHPAHPGRPAPEPGALVRGGDHRLFWSLNFAVRSEVWDRVGGFCDAYEGYGAEDTDFAMMALQHGVDLTWVGGAAAFHQWHPTSNPPRQHLDDILRNGRLYAERWGRWPMDGWLHGFADEGLIGRVGDGWERLPPRSGAASGGRHEKK
jgi:N-acetylglucosaminyl-diphospho-decaprenol L-rhamnosyltransferase